MEPAKKKAKFGDGKPGQSKVSVDASKRLIVVIENATLEVVKAGKDHQLLNCDDHQHIIRKAGKSIADCRPDITHQCLLALLDSPLNKAGLLQVYIHTAQNVLIEVNPQIRIPRTFKRFSGLMVKLLFKLKIRSASGDATLLKVIRNPIIDHLPPGCRKIACSFSANKLVDLKDYVPMLPKDEPICFSIGGFAHGDLLGLDYTVRPAFARSSVDLLLSGSDRLVHRRQRRRSSSHSQSIRSQPRLPARGWSRHSNKTGACCDGVPSGGATAVCGVMTPNRGHLCTRSHWRKHNDLCHVFMSLTMCCTLHSCSIRTLRARMGSRYSLSAPFARLSAWESTPLQANSASHLTQSRSFYTSAKRGSISTGGASHRQSRHPLR